MSDEEWIQKCKKKLDEYLTYEEEAYERWKALKGYN